MSVAASNHRVSVALSDPLTAVLLWGLAFSGKLDHDVLALLGLKNVDVELIEQRFSTQLTELRVLARTSMLFDPQRLGQLAMARISTLLLMASVGTLDGEKALTQATRALARLPLWLRDPELDRLEREARRETAMARIEEVNARRAEAQARRMEALARSASAGRGQVAAPLGKDSVLAAVAQAQPGSMPAEPPVPAAEHCSTLQAASKTSFPGADSSIQVKSDALSSEKPAFPGAFPGIKVKDHQDEAISEGQAPQPAALRQPAPQGRRKLPKAVRRAAGARR